MESVFLWGEEGVGSGSGGRQLGTDSTKLGSGTRLIIMLDGGWKNRRDASVADSLTSDSSDTVREASEREASGRVGGTESETAQSAVMAAGGQEVEPRVGGEEGGTVGDGAERTLAVFLFLSAYVLFDGVTRQHTCHSDLGFMTP